ncbi:MAG: biotin/lipoyl-binding protein [Candidatus Protistobacter heckmanni]|nr:biotin/lipoyl-binding protein [Candidatus Protistobacter heckmanni]
MKFKVSRKQALIGLLVVAVLGAGGTWYYFHQQEAGKTTAQGGPGGFGGPGGPGGPGGMRNRPMSVVAATVKTGDIVVTQTALGTVTPRNVVTVSSRVDGELTHVYFKEGEEVEAGQLLAEIDPRSFQGALDRDRALLRNAELDLQRYKTLM